MSPLTPWRLGSHKGGFQVEGSWSAASSTPSSFLGAPTRQQIFGNDPSSQNWIAVRVCLKNRLEKYATLFQNCQSASLGQTGSPFQPPQKDLSPSVSFGVWFGFGRYISRQGLMQPPPSPSPPPIVLDFLSFCLYLLSARMAGVLHYSGILPGYAECPEWYPNLSSKHHAN